MSDASILDRTRRYYEGRLREHGTVPRGVDWNSAESQALRFDQLARLLDGTPDASVLDYGCGYGALAPYLRERGHTGAYVGFDVSPAMVEAARLTVAGLPACSVTADRASLAPADVVVASGIFNVRMDVPEADWRVFVHDTLDDLASLARTGFAFNVLSLHSDPDRRRPDLYYADPCELFEACCERFSPRVALLHDYPLYEFTVLVRL